MAEPSTLTALCDPDRFDAAVTLAVRGKRRRADVAWFLFERDRNVARLTAALANGTWRPGRFDALRIRDPKPRVIARASVADRIVQTAVAQLIAPGFLRSASEIDFACRAGFGTHRAILALLHAVRRHRFAVHLDVRSYFPSIELERLTTLIARRVRDRGLRVVIDRILAAGRGFYDPPAVRRDAGIAPDWPPAGRGLPIGAVTSQLFAAHVYLQELDHRVKRVLRVPAAVRYVDDLFLFGDRRADLRAWRSDVAEWCLAERGLRLKHPQARILSCAGHLDALGVRIRRDGIEPGARAWRRLRVRLRRCVRDGDPTLGELRTSLRSQFATSFRF
ncbi:MAG: RNA-directed DNA polymerase [Planctomycetes bacterium]|nr:RNA-directed DNA polymerase [Planctomycetota bacterium]